ncbi:hypothetical protein Tco_0169052 [Tanacetum coccineum]
MPTKDKTTVRSSETKIENNAWRLYTDEASSSDGSDAGLKLISLKGKEYTYALFQANGKLSKGSIQSQAADNQAIPLKASMTFEHLTKEVLVEILAKQSIEGREVSKIETEKEENWMTPIYEYLLSGPLLEDPKESRKIRVKAPQYKLIKGSLYKKSFLTPWLRCIGPSQANGVVKEIHKGSCGFNPEPRSMVVKITK